MRLALRLIEVILVFVSRASASALAPPGAYSIFRKSIQVSVVFFFQGCGNRYSARVAYPIGTKKNRGKCGVCFKDRGNSSGALGAHAIE